MKEDIFAYYIGRENIIFIGSFTSRATQIQICPFRQFLCPVCNFLLLRVKMARLN